MPGSDRYAKVSSAAHSARALLRVMWLSLQRAIAVWAGVAQLVEHLICNQRVGGSSPSASSSSSQRGNERWIWLYCSTVLALQTSGHSFKGGVPARFASGIDDGLDGLRWVLRVETCQAGCAQVAEWLMAADCKSAALCATEVRILPCAPLVLSCEF